LADKEASQSDSDGEQNKKRDASSSESEGEEYLDEVHDNINVNTNKLMAQKTRQSVSAEVFGKYHIKEAFKAKVIPKSADVTEKIHERLSGAFMFMSLDEKEMKVVIDAMD
jgi:hypothetical protein